MTKEVAEPRRWMWGELPDGRRYRIDLPLEDCPKCDRIFPTKQALENHIKLDH